jgi:hypothetical protein
MTALDLCAIARPLGGEVSGRRVLAPGPQRSPKDRSVCVGLPLWRDRVPVTLDNKNSGKRKAPAATGASRKVSCHGIDKAKRLPAQ